MNLRSRRSSRQGVPIQSRHMEQTLDRGRESPPIPSLRNDRSSGRSFHVGLDSKLSGWTYFTATKGSEMATYECSSCGMSVNATCGICDAPLVDDTIERDDGSTVQVSRCPNDHGKIKSPVCCGADMSCSVR